MVDFVIRVAGENGENVLSVGDIMAQALARAGLNIYTFQNLPAEIKGGASMTQVRVSDGPVGAPGDGVDVLFAWNQQNYGLHSPVVRDGGMILYDPSECTPDGLTRLKEFAVPLTEIANQTIGERRTKNVVAIGALSGLSGISIELVETIMQQKFGRRANPKLMEMNFKALKAGYEFARENLPLDVIRVTGLRATEEPRMILTGNQALYMGAIAAGLQYYAGYPITPASDIMEYLAKHLPRVGGVVIQTEDEISAVCSCIGASFAGRKAMTATSGPGLSLMVEAMGLATMQELPLVIVNVQRGGPSTGLPTKVEQSDLDLAIYGHHGDAPRIVIAPTTVEDLFYGTIDAFNLAEKYQVPVILLSDQHLSHRAEAVPVPDLSKLHVINRKTPTAEEMEDYKRYALTEDHVSPVAIPGVHSTTWVGTGLEHDEHAHIQASNSRTHVLMSDKRAEKVRQAADEPNAVHRFGNSRARFGIIGWGSSEGPLREAVARLEDQGIEVRALVARIVSPVPEKPIQEFLDSVDQVAVLELNQSGQFANLLQSTFCRRVLKFTKYDGLPFRTQDICEMIQEAMHAREGALTR
ncbi:MAG TPA: 2-oxoacid:acceptor oxidoreductase subunit alpha [Armatimonadota bacterium]|nr:2-oxoacid:acceptor oxidoreductase subunit alpha [Armatimonadota bacterium]